MILRTDLWRWNQVCLDRILNSNMMSVRSDWPQTQHLNLIYWKIHFILWHKPFWLKHTHTHTQCEISDLSFIWDKMRIIAQETAFQIALKNCSKEVTGRSVYRQFWWKGYMQSSPHFWRKLLLASWRLLLVMRKSLLMILVPF